MKKEYILGVLFFSGLWGLSEAGLGGLLYAAKVPFSSVVLTLIAFGILAISRAYLPQRGTATLIGLCAMLFKFFNSPVFACHFLGIAMIGVSFDLFISILNIKNKAIAGFAAAFFNYVAFAVMMTFIIRYHYWTGSLDKFTGHIIAGIFAAVGCAGVVPVMLNAGQLIKARLETPFNLKFNMVSFATAGLWGFSLVVFSRTLIAG
jgi:hypothetical protein